MRQRWLSGGRRSFRGDHRRDDQHFLEQRLLRQEQRVATRYPDTENGDQPEIAPRGGECAAYLTRRPMHRTILTTI